MSLVYLNVSIHMLYCTPSLLTCVIAILWIIFKCIFHPHRKTKRNSIPEWVHSVLTHILYLFIVYYLSYEMRIIYIIYVLSLNLRNMCAYLWIHYCIFHSCEWNNDRCLLFIDLWSLTIYSFNLLHVFLALVKT